MNDATSNDSEVFCGSCLNMNDPLGAPEKILKLKPCLLLFCEESS